jgi:hypothetical protein
MSVPDVVQLASVLIEIIIAIVAIVIATKKQKTYGWLIALTFALYVLFDLSRLGVLPLAADLISGLFLIASLSMLGAIWLMFRDG